MVQGKATAKPSLLSLNWTPEEEKATARILAKYPRQVVASCRVYQHLSALKDAHFIQIVDVRAVEGFVFRVRRREGSPLLIFPVSEAMPLTLAHMATLAGFFGPDIKLGISTHDGVCTFLDVRPGFHPSINGAESWSKDHLRAPARRWCRRAPAKPQIDDDI